LRFHQSWLRVFTAAAAIALVTACTPDAPDTLLGLKASPQLSAAVVAEPAGSPTTKHVFLMNSKAPAGFADAVTAAGGSLAYSFDEIGVVVTDGLTDDAAKELAQGNGRVERDLMLQWVPTPVVDEGSLVEYAAVEAEAHNPATAAFFLSNQWNMRQIKAHDAWTAGAQAPGVRVAILDTGLDDTHLDQRGLIDMVASRAFVQSISPVPGPPWRDDHLHGTHVGSIVVANGFGVSGVAPHAQLIAVKVLNAAGNGTFGDIIAGIIYATNVGADVINMSLGATFPKNARGGGPLVAAMNRAINYAHENDVVVVSAGGNEFLDLQHNGNWIYVPCESGVGMCVSALGSTEQKASYTNYGSSAIHVAAPGGEPIAPPQLNRILGPCSTYSIPIVACRRPFPTSFYRYVHVYGTSQATPHVSGIAALLRARGYQQASQIITMIQQTSDDLGKPGTDQIYGAGRVNAFRAWTGN